MTQPDENGWYTEDRPQSILDAYDNLIIECVVNDGTIKQCELDWWDDEYSYEGLDGETEYDYVTCLDIYVKGTNEHISESDIIKWRILKDDEDIS